VAEDSREHIDAAEGGDMFMHMFLRYDNRRRGTGLRQYGLAGLAAVLGLLWLLAAPAVAEGPKVTPLMAKELAGLSGKEGVMLTVEYAPGGSSAPHRHNAHTFVYVLEGTVVMQVTGGNAVTLGPGQTFYESPEDVHLVSKNASDSQPAKFLVFSVREKGTPAVIPVQ
jgi:quercetin dioxygenase-like cupin family protein